MVDCPEDTTYHGHYVTYVEDYPIRMAGKNVIRAVVDAGGWSVLMWRDAFIPLDDPSCGPEWEEWDQDETS